MLVVVALDTTHAALPLEEAVEVVVVVEVEVETKEHVRDEIATARGPLEFAALGHIHQRNFDHCLDYGKIKYKIIQLAILL